VSDDLALALALADDADKIALARFRARDLVVSTKPDATPVTEADTAVEDALRARLAAERPDDGFLGEETGDSSGAAGRRWIVDPIDGTRNYLRGTSRCGRRSWRWKRTARSAPASSPPRR
jgi:histidinol-phosphatase